MEGAKIYAENAIRKKNEELNMLRLSSRIDAVASRVQTAVAMRKVLFYLTKQVTSSMASVVKNMDSAMQSMNLEKISMIMDKFESQFENLDVQTQYMETSMGNTTTLTTPAEQVNGLIQQVADAHGLEVNMQMGDAPKGVAQAQGNAEADDLNERLAKLRNNS